MAEAVVGFLLQNLTNLLKSKVSLLKDAKEELKKLEADLETMKAHLKKVEGWAEDPVLIVLEKHIRQAVYTAEDIIDTSLTKKFRNKSWKETLKNSVGANSTLSLANKVKIFREETLQPLLSRTLADLRELTTGDVSAGARAGTSHRNYIEMFSGEDNMVGLADEEAKIISYLEEKTEELDVISIVGMPGLGKTTLASKVYNNDSIKRQFPTLMWVNVSQEFNVKDMFLAILKTLNITDGINSLNVPELANKVKSCLGKKVFLLIMDDVWTIEDWDKIKVALPQNTESGKVLLTSRHEYVATHANPNREPHPLRFLNFKESWELFQRVVFRRNNACPQDLEDFGKNIADECGGVPMAIVVIGGILVETGVDNRGLWKDVSDSVGVYIRDDKQKRTKSIISLSYKKLPYELRDCFLYLGMFRERTVIPAWKLTRLWIAEGFIQQNQYQETKSVEKVAQEILNDLVARNLVMVEKIKADGDVKTCRVHDLIREFCKKEAGLENKNLFQEMKKNQGVFPKISEIENYRRLCIHSHVVDFLRQKVIKGANVRSLLCSSEAFGLPKEDIHSIPEAFELLRVIDASPIKFAKFPSKITKLIHLRYLTLSGDNYTALPKDTSNLWNLQTVMIDTVKHEFEIKADIGSMQQLRHLKTKAAIVLEEVKGDEGGENLQTLSRLSTKSCTKAVFSRAKNLQNLGIRGPLSDLVDANYLKELEHLEKLKLVHDTHPKVASENPLNSLSLWNGFPPNLKSLTLSSTFLDWTEMATLGNLHKLEVLKLKENAFKDKQWAAEGFSFRCLVSLHIVRITNLKIWTASGDPFPRLQNLIIKNCEELLEIPPVLWNSLQFVEIEKVRESLVEVAKRIKVEKEQQEQGGQIGGRKGGFKLKIS